MLHILGTVREETQCCTAFIYFVYLLEFAFVDMIDCAKLSHYEYFGRWKVSLLTLLLMSRQTNAKFPKDSNLSRQDVNSGTQHRQWIL